MEIKEGFGFKEIILENVDEFIELIRPDKKNINQYLESVNGKFIGGVLKSMLTLNEAIIDVKEG